MQASVTVRRSIRLALVVGALATSGCAALSSSGTPSYSTSAKENYDKGLAELKAESWIEALKYFQYTKGKFGFSKWATRAELGIADANLGREKYQEAIDDYRQFARSHPTHEQVQNGYAAFKICEAFVKQIPSDWFLVPPSFEKDQGPVRDALHELVGDERNPGFIGEYPDSPFFPRAKKMAADATRRLAEHELYVANFYLERGKPAAAVGRLEGLLREYPHAVIEPEVLLLLGRTYIKQDKPALALRTFERLAINYSNDYRGRKARLYIDHIQRRWGAVAAAPAPSLPAPSAQPTTPSPEGSGAEQQ